jgi:hypothetical protein
MTNPQENSHRAVVVLRPEEPVDSPTNAVCDLEFASLDALVSSGAEELLRPRVDTWARELAEPFGSDNTRARHLARDIALLRMRLVLNDRRREVLFSAGDPVRSMLLERILQTDGRRLEGLMRCLREEQRGGARTVQIGSVTFNDRAQVNVLATQGVPDAVPR